MKVDAVLTGPGDRWFELDPYLRDGGYHVTLSQLRDLVGREGLCIVPATAELNAAAREGKDYKDRPPEQSGGQPVESTEWVSEFALQVIPIATLRPDQLFAFRAPPGFAGEPHSIMPVEIIVNDAVAMISGKAQRQSAAAVVWRRMVRAK